MWLVDQGTTSPFKIYKETGFTSLYSAVEALKKYASNSVSVLPRCTMRIRLVHKLSGKAQGCKQVCVDDGSCSAIRITTEMGKITEFHEIGFSHHHLWSMPDKLYYTKNKTN